MEKKEDEQQLQQPALAKKRWWQFDPKGFGSVIVVGFIWALAQSFNKSTFDGLIILGVAIGAGFFYYRLKSRIKIKNEVIRVIATFFLIAFIAGGLIGFLTAVTDGIILRTSSNQTIQKHDAETQNIQWQEFNSTVGSFKILFPTTPTIKEQNSQSNDTVNFKGEFYSSVLNDSAAYFVSYTEYLTKMDTSDIDGNLEKVANGIVAIYPGSKLVSTKLKDFDGYRGIDLLINISNETTYLKGRIIMIGQRLYVIYETYRVSSYNENDYNKFINSFQLQ